MEECVRMMQQTLRASPSIKKRAKSVYSQRNLGTIKDRKREKKEEKEVGSGEIIMRILRMRYVFSHLWQCWVPEVTRTRTDRARRTSLRSSCRYWLRSRQNRSSASANSRNGSCRGQVLLPAHRISHLCPKSLPDLIFAVPPAWLSLWRHYPFPCNFFFLFSPRGYLCTPYHFLLPPRYSASFYCLPCLL